MLTYSYICKGPHIARRCLFVELPRVLHGGAVLGETCSVPRVLHISAVECENEEVPTI